MEDAPQDIIRLIITYLEPLQLQNFVHPETKFKYNCFDFVMSMNTHSYIFGKFKNVVIVGMNIVGPIRGKLDDLRMLSLSEWAILDVNKFLRLENLELLNMDNCVKVGGVSIRKYHNNLFEIIKLKSKSEFDDWNFVSDTSFRNLRNYKNPKHYVFKMKMKMMKGKCVCLSHCTLNRLILPEGIVYLDLSYCGIFVRLNLKNSLVYLDLTMFRKWDSMIGELYECVNLVWLNLSHLSIKDIGFLERMEKLEFLDLSSCSRIVCGDSLERCRKLYFLNMTYCFNLKTIRIPNSLKLLDMGYCDALEEIVGGYNLKCLRLIKFRGVVDIRLMQKLVYVNLAGCDIVDLWCLEGVKVQVLILKGCKRLVSLRGLNCEKLVKLHLGECCELGGIDDELANVPELWYLDLSNCKLVNGVDCLGRLNGCKLSYLDLYGCSDVCRRSVFELYKRIPQLKILGCGLF